MVGIGTGTKRDMCENCNVCISLAVITSHTIVLFFFLFIGKQFKTSKST